MLTVMRYGASGLTQCFFATGRSCLVHLIRKYSPGIAHLPEMLPEGLYLPFAKEGVETTRYKLQPNLEPDLDSLEYCLRRHKAERPLVVLVHYFGYWMPSHMPAALAHAHGGLLLEDCAHCLPPSPDSPSNERRCADICLYSINKFFPVPGGALMISSSPAADLTPPSILPKLQEDAVAAYRQHLAENRILAAMPPPTTDLERLAMHGVMERSEAAYDAYYQIISGDMEPKQAEPSWYGDPEERHRRFKCAQHLYNQIPQHMRYRNGYPAFAFPIKCEDVLSLKMKLNASGVVPHQTSSKWSVPDEFKSHLLLPLNRSINFDFEK